MAKKFDIYITDGVKNYDIRLNRRATVYGIIVHTLPCHYSESAKNEIIFDSRSKNVLAHRFISVQRTSSTKLDSNTITGQLKKHEKAGSAASMTSKVRESVVKFSTPAQSEMQVTAKLDTTGKRRRMLYEMDADTLATFDDMTLDAVDFVTIS